MHHLALRFPFLHLEALSIDVHSERVVLVSARNKVIAATNVCLHEGIELGMPLNTASMITPCKSVARNVAKETALLNRICDVLYAFTPYIERYCPNPKGDFCDQGLLLGLTRSIRLFKGLEPLISRITVALEQLNIVFAFATAHSARAAWLLSYLEKDANLDSTDIALLEEYPEAAEALEGAGFKTLGDVRVHIDKEGLFSLQKRLKPDFIQYLTDILPPNHQHQQVPEQGDGSLSGLEQLALFSAKPIQKPLVVYQPKLAFSECIEFDFPVASIELLHEPMQTLLSRLCQYLVSTQQQCNGVTWRFRDIYREEALLQVKTERIYRDSTLLFQLSQIKLEAQGLPFEVDQIELLQPLLSPVHFESHGLDNSTQNKSATPKDIQLLTAKLQARVGEDNVFKVSSENSHIPELSQHKADVGAQVNNELLGEHQYGDRPPWLLNEPVFIGENQNNLYWHGRMQIIRGPEKLATQWWAESVNREYFVAVREDHVRLWIFNDILKGDWRVQGVF